MASADVINTLIAEAGGEGDAGLIAAAWAIQQRAAARGQTIDQVIKSGFDGYSNPGSGAVRAQQDPRLRAKVEQIVTGVQNGTIPNPVPGADHFLSGDAMPSWAKGMKPVATIGGHRFYASGDVPQEAYGPLIPPGELPEVASLTDTVPGRPVPVTPSPQMNTMRSPPPLPPSRPSSGYSPDYIQKSMASLPKAMPVNLGDQIGMSPIQGGSQQAPLFDAGYDERMGAMRLMPEALDTQGMFTARSPSPPRLLPPIPPSTLGQPPATRTVQSVPVTPRPQVPGNTYAGQDRAMPSALPNPIPTRPGVTRTASLAGNVALPPGVRPQVPSTTAAVPQSETQRLAALYANGGPTRPFVQMPNMAEVAAGTGFRVPQSAQFVYDPAASQPTRLPALNPNLPDPVQVIPGLPRAPRVAPVPFGRPSFMTAAMPPMPPIRPTRPIPLQRPAQQAPARSPLRITVNGANPLPVPQQQSGAVQQFRNQGMSPAQAYDAANRAAAERARDRSGNTTERSDYFKMATGG